MVQKLNAAANKMLATDDIRKVPAIDGAAPSAGTPSDLAAFYKADFYKADYDQWGVVMAKAGIKKN